MKVNELEFAVPMDVITNYQYNVTNIEQEKILALSTYKKNKKFIDTINKILKRGIDIIAGIVGTIILIPLVAIVWILNKIYKEDDGPLFFIQERIGKNGKLFKMIKFRSMCVGADEKLERFLSENEDIKKEYVIYKKLKSDPRITKAGKFLRKTSLDEWPQFLSLLTGEMSLVGPRPYLPREVDEMGKYYEIIIQDTPRLDWVVASTVVAQMLLLTIG